MNVDPYESCPVYETERFTVRLVREDDAKDLLCCYSDIKAQEFFNADYCTSDFRYKMPEEMQECIRSWLEFYANKAFIRFSVIDRQTSKAIGTIEMFGCEMKSNETYMLIGVLRIDIASEYEKESRLKELLTLSENFYEAFGVDAIITKAIPEATERIQALIECGYKNYDSTISPPRIHYYIRYA